MRRIKTVLILGLVMGMLFVNGQSLFAAKKNIELTYWTTMGQHPRFNEWMEDLGKELTKTYPYVKGVKIIAVPYEGYEAKYLSAMEGKVGAPDMFNGMVYDWAGAHDFCALMPEYLVKNIEEHTVPAVRKLGVWDGKMYGVPGSTATGSSFMMLYINTDMLEEAGMDPNSYPETIDELLDFAKKLTKHDASGKVVRAGYAIRYSGNPTGITEKFLPFLHTFGGRMMSPDRKRASGYINSSESVEALQFFADLVNKYRVSSLEIGSPAASFGHKLAAMIFREGWVVGWLRDNAPNLHYKIYPLPTYREKVGVGALFTWTDLVYKYGSNKEESWKYLELVWKNSLGGCIIDEVAPPPWKEDLNCSYMINRPDKEATTEMMSRASSPNYGYIGAHLTEVASIMADAIGGSLYLKKTPKTALDEAAVKIDALLME